MSDQDLFERFKRRAVEVLSVEDAQVKLEAKFADDLDADSLDLVESSWPLEESSTSTSKSKSSKESTPSGKPSNS